LATAKKGALKEGRTIVFADQSGFYLLPMLVRTYAPVGQRPVLDEHSSRDHLSVMSGITLDGKLYMMEQERGAFEGEDVVRFLKHLMGQIEGKLLLIWDGAPISPSLSGAQGVPSGRSGFSGAIGATVPGYASGSQPRRGDLEAPQKCVELKNLCCRSLSELRVELRKAKERLRHKRDVILGCIRQPGFEV